MKIALQEAKVRKELNVLLNSDESMLNLFSTVFYMQLPNATQAKKILSVNSFSSSCAREHAGLL